MNSDRHISARMIERLGLPQPQVMTPEKTLFVEKCPLELPPDLIAHHVFRVALQAGCEVISVKRGRWRYEFKVQDLVPKGLIVTALAQPKKLAAFGESALKMKMQGNADFGEMKGPQTTVAVRPPWNQPRAENQTP